MPTTRAVPDATVYTVYSRAEQMVFLKWSMTLYVDVSVNVNVDLYSALSHSASNALNVPNNAETRASSIGERSWRCSVLDHAGGWSVRSRRSDQPRRTHDGTVRVELYSWHDEWAAAGRTKVLSFGDLGDRRTQL